LFIDSVLPFFFFFFFVVVVLIGKPRHGAHVAMPKASTPVGCNLFALFAVYFVSFTQVTA